MVEILSLLTCYAFPGLLGGLGWITVSLPKQLGTWPECLLGSPCWIGGVLAVPPVSLS